MERTVRMPKPRVVKTICNMCVARCGIDVAVDKETIVDVTGMQEHPFNMLCAKVRGLPELVHSQQRLVSPLRKTSRGFKKISWEEALDRIANQLLAYKERYGARSLLVHLGVPFIYSQTEYMARRFCDLYGTPNYTTGASFCFLARVIGHCLTCGHHISAHYPGIPECMVIWGQNPTESRLMQADHIHALMGRGSKLVVVDPRKTPLAKQADLHAQIRPGTDCALALALLNVIIEEERYDKSFVQNWTVGFDELIGHIGDYTPERVEAVTWIPEIYGKCGLCPMNLVPGLIPGHGVTGPRGDRMDLMLSWMVQEKVYSVHTGRIPAGLPTMGRSQSFSNPIMRLVTGLLPSLLIGLKPMSINQCSTSAITTSR
jgi:anaerobic selenocysteine-containing dehydrogenase